VLLLSFIVFNSIEIYTVFSCGAGCDLCTMDAVNETSVLDCAASSQETCQGSTILYNGL